MASDREFHAPTEIDLVHNPSLGAYLLWRAAKGHFAEANQALPVALAFLVLPIILHKHACDLVHGTNKSSGLTLFAAKLGTRQEDILAVHPRALALRSLGLSSIAFACSARMLVLNSRSAVLLPVLDCGVPKQGEVVSSLGAAAEKLGAWFGRLPLEQVVSTLRVEF